MFDLKRIIALMIAVAALMISGAAFAVPVGNANTSEQELQAPQLLLTGIVIGIDPGHQNTADNSLEPVSPDDDSKTKAKMTAGAVGVRTGAKEQDINLLVAVKLAALLKKQGATVILTHSTNDVAMSNIDRAKLMNESGVSFWIRLHCNSAKSQKVSGASVIAPGRDSDVFNSSSALAQYILSSFCDGTGAKNGGVIFSDNQTGFNWSVSPVITIEMGYLSNPAEDVLLCRSYYQNLCANALLNGILAYCSKGANQ